MKNILTLLFLIAALGVAHADVKIQTATLARGTAGTGYDVTLKAEDGRAPYLWSLRSGTLPPGVVLSAGHLIGVPTSAGTFSFKLRVRDGKDDSATRSFTLTVKPATFTPPVIPPTTTTNTTNVVTVPGAPSPLPFGVVVATPDISQITFRYGTTYKNDGWYPQAGRWYEFQQSSDGATWRHFNNTAYGEVIWSNQGVPSITNIWRKLVGAESRLAPPPVLHFRLVDWTGATPKPTVDFLITAVWR